MFDSLESFLLGLATVIDTVLLITLFERTNRPLVALWLKLLIGFAWLTHASSFVHVLLTTTPGNTALRLDQLSMFGLAIGLWCLPQAMLHAAIRLYHTGVATHPPLDRRYLGVYVPSLLLPWLAVLIATNESRSFLDSVEPVIYPYLVGVLLTNGVCAAIFFQLRHRIPVAGARSFFQQLSLMLIAMTILLVLFVTRFRDSEWDASARLLTQLSPLFTVLLFAWYTFRHRLLPLVFERTLVYGASLTVVLLVHQFFVQPWTEKISEQAQFDFIWIEILAIFAGILAWKPLRYRVLESLRYLLSNNVFKTRNATRRISLELSKRARQSPDAMKQWMESTLEQELGLEFARIWIVEQGSTTLQIPLVEAPGAVEKDLQSLFATMEESPLSSIDRTEDCSKELFEMLVRLNTMAVFRFHFESMKGLVLLGSRHRSDRLGTEQTTSLSLLFDQFAVTLHNRWQEQLRMEAERKAMQQEKLSVLGLLAGSLAHELRNPLSSIRTIAKLLNEDLGTHHPHRRDIDIIIEEIDRLTQTTNRLLDFCRPANETRKEVEPEQVVQRTLHILNQLARQYGVEIASHWNGPGRMIEATDGTLSEISFNLIRNGIEAAREVEAGKVRVETQVEGSDFVFRVSDNGMGIAPELRDTLFQPFTTSKKEGTGLGLYVTAERVRELGGTISSETAWPRGTSFEVRLPCFAPTAKISE